MKILKTKKYSILSNILKFSFIFVFAFMLITPILYVNADTNITTTINNPLGPNGPQNIPDFIKKVIEVVLTVGVPVIVLAIIYTGFLFVKAQGNSEAITKAKASLMYTLIGAALLLGAFVIAQAIGATVKDISSGV